MRLYSHNLNTRARAEYARKDNEPRPLRYARQIVDVGRKPPCLIALCYIERLECPFHFVCGVLCCAWYVLTLSPVTSVNKTSPFQRFRLESRSNQDVLAPRRREYLPIDPLTMSDNLQPTRYAECFLDNTKLCKSTKTYRHQFRVLVMELFMDYLSMDQIHKFFFVYELPARLKDRGNSMLRTELLTYIDEQLLDTWRKTPSELQEVLKTLGRSDLSTKVHELVGKCDKSCAIN